MANRLPPRPNLEHLRSQAKSLLSDLRAGKPAAARTFITHLPAARNMTAAAVRRAGFRLADAQSAIARQSGFAAWPNLARHVEHLRALEGEWAFAALEIDGAALPPPVFAGSRLLIDGDRFRMESVEATYDGVFTIDVDATPARIDIEFVEGPEAGNSSYGIYELDEDRLVLCLGLVGAPRPHAFATRPGSGHALERLRRASAARPPNVSGGSRQAPAAAPVAAPSVVDETGFDGPVTPLLERLQGDWQPTLLVASGEPLAARMLAFGARSIQGRETRVVFGGQTMVHAKIRLDESCAPIAIDYLHIGRGPRVVSLGILDWQGDEVRICMAEAGAPRPADFSAAPGSKRTMSQWRRVATADRST